MQTATCKLSKKEPSRPPSPQPVFVPEALEEGAAERCTSAVPSTTTLDPTPDLAGEAMGLGQSSCERRLAVCIRVGAWMMHAMIDGMVLASAPSTYVMVATLLPISVCALQDTAAFIVTMARLGYSSQRSLTVSVVALACAFPTGALVSHAVLASASSVVAVNVVRTVVSGIFTYMAIFELAPPHTHCRKANAVYLLCFTCGAAMGYLADAVQHLSAEWR